MEPVPIPLKVLVPDEPSPQMVRWVESRNKLYLSTPPVPVRVLDPKVPEPLLRAIEYDLFFVQFTVMVAVMSSLSELKTS